MKRQVRTVLVAGSIFLVIAAALWAQRRWPGLYSGSWYSRGGVPQWQNDPEFATDVFTFVRIRYDSYYGGRHRGGGWATDAPANDLNFSFRLQQLTSLKVDPEPKVLRLTEPGLFRYPFIYIVEPGALHFSEAEVKALRRYLDNGGFLMVDDFWGEDEWYNFSTEIRRVFPDRQPLELPLEHPVFHCVYEPSRKTCRCSTGCANWLAASTT